MYYIISHSKQIFMITANFVLLLYYFSLREPPSCGDFRSHSQPSDLNHDNVLPFSTYQAQTWVSLNLAYPCMSPSQASLVLSPPQMLLQGLRTTSAWQTQPRDSPQSFVKVTPRT